MTVRLSSFVCLLLTPMLMVACASAPPPASSVVNPNLDAETQSLIDKADRVVFVIPFSHWDTDWHEAFPDYVKRSDQNILAAIQLAGRDPRFRYTIEQVLFAQHFWDNYPEYRAELKALVQNRQITFAWAGITQPETSLVAPEIQVRNWQLGRDWIAQTFGGAVVPHSAWQSDAFGTSAAFPIFLSRFDIPYLFIGRSQHRCAPNDATCQALPQAFYWRSPAAPDVRVLVAYISYPTAWDAIHQLPDEDAQLAALRTVVDQQFQRTTSKYIFLPMGSDFIDPMSDLSSLIDRWNASDKSTVLVMADPDTAFQYLATQNLPEFTVDLNPIWQAFYASRPYAKIADKESAYFLTAAEDFGKAIDAPQSAAWLTATINAHYDNVGAVSFDTIWESTQRPRFEQTVATAAADLSHTLARIASNASSVDSPLLVFNPSTWPRSGIVEIEGDLPPPGQLPAPAQQIAPGHIAFHVSNVPPIGYASPIRSQAVITQPATVSQSDPLVTLANGLVTVTLDADHGGVFSRLIAASTEILSGPGDDVTYIDDNGDIYGSFFGAVRTRESQTPAHIKVLAAGPLIARAQAIFALGGQAVTKTVTLRAGEPVVDVQLDIKALPQTTALVQTPTTIDTTSRTDDLGFTSFTHPIDSRPIVSGDVTYRREIFYPIMYWSDVSADGVGLGLITHGLQGLGGTGTLSLMLVRQVDDQGHEGVTDAVYHTLRYAYVPHVGAGVDLPHLADEFNQPLIPVWRSGDQPVVQLPFQRNN